MASFGEKLKALRKEKGWSQDVLGEKVGIHGRHIGKYEIGKAMPNAETVIKIAEVFDVSIDYLLLTDDTIPHHEKIRDKTLLKNFQAVEAMDEDDKNIVKALIEAFIKKQQIEAVLQE